MKGSDGAIAEAIGVLRHMWVHRKVQVKIKNKTLLDIDHTIPGLVDDTILAIWGSRQRDLKPMIIETHKKDGGIGWDLVIYIPPGISYRDVAGKLNYFADATGGAVEIKKQGKAAVMTVLVDELRRNYPYQWTAEGYDKMFLPYPVGWSAGGFIVDDLTEYPNIIMAGHPGAGKSNMLHIILVSALLNRPGLVWPVIIDLKRIEFSYLKNHAILAGRIGEVREVLKAINKELDKRADYLNSKGVAKNQELKTPLPWILLVVDELAEMCDKECQELLNRIVRLGRAPGIVTVAATQRPSSTMFQAWGDSKAMFAGTLCFRVRDEVNSRIVLGNDRASLIPEIPGRGVYQWEREIEVQTLNLPIAKAKKLIRDLSLTPLSSQRGSVMDVCKFTPKRLPPRQSNYRGSNKTPMLEHRPDPPPIL